MIRRTGFNIKPKTCNEPLNEEEKESSPSFFLGGRLDDLRFRKLCFLPRGCALVKEVSFEETITPSGSPSSTGKLLKEADEVAQTSSGDIERFSDNIIAADDDPPAENNKGYLGGTFGR